MSALKQSRYYVCGDSSWLLILKRHCHHHQGNWPSTPALSPQYCVYNLWGSACSHYDAGVNIKELLLEKHGSRAWILGTAFLNEQSNSSKSHVFWKSRNQLQIQLQLASMWLINSVTNFVIKICLPACFISVLQNTGSQSCHWLEWCTFAPA